MGRQGGIIKIKVGHPGPVYRMDPFGLKVVSHNSQPFRIPHHIQSGVGKSMPKKPHGGESQEQISDSAGVKDEDFWGIW